MISRSFLFVLLVFIVACKDKDTPSQVKTEPESPIEVQEEEKVAWDPEQFYKPAISADGDTLMPLIPQDSVAVFFTRYAKQHPQNKIIIHTDYGDIHVQLYDEPAIYRGNILFLANHDYYKTTYFYRVAEGFVIQGGDSDNTYTAMMRSSTGKYELPIDTTHNRVHKRGTVSMARQYEDNPDKAMSPFNFFICMKRSPHLDGEHTIIGEVTKGMDVATKINQVKTDQSEWPLEDVYLDIEVVGGE